MSQIAHDFFARSPLMAAPLVAMLIFIAVFVVVVARVMRTKKTDLDRSASLPLDEGGNDV
jgi:hypothetical protein